MLKIKFYKFCILGLSLIVSLVGCQSKLIAKKKYSETRLLMGTVIQLDICRNSFYTSNLNAAFSDAWARLKEISWRMNVYDGKSDLSKINNSDPGKPVVVGKDTYELLERSVSLYHITRKSFDITVLPLLELWRKMEKYNQAPSKIEIQNMISQLGPGNIQFLDDYKIARSNNIVQLDLGGNAKGYAVDQVAAIFRDYGFNNFYIDAGGDVYVGGHNCEGGLWRIGIRDPQDKSKVFEVVNVSDAAVATSGNYEQFVIIQGERYSHIINPIKGYPQKTVVSASVIAPSAERADVLATAITVLQHEAGLALIKEMGEGYSALILEKSDNSAKMKRHQSENFNKYTNLH